MVLRVRSSAGEDTGARHAARNPSSRGCRWRHGHRERRVQEGANHGEATSEKIRSQACGTRRHNQGQVRASQAAEHSRHLGRRYRAVEPQLLHPRPDGLPHPQHRPHRQGRHAVHRLLRRAVLHRRPLVLHHRAERLSHRPVQGRHPGRAGRHDRRSSSPSRRCSRSRATPPGSSARTISAT